MGRFDTDCCRLHKALETYAPEESPGFVSLEGYIAGRFVIEVAERCGRDIDRRCFMQNCGTATCGPWRIRVAIGAMDSQGSNEVFLTVIGADGITTLST